MKSVTAAEEQFTNSVEKQWMRNIREFDTQLAYAEVLHGDNFLLC